jgi:hypothetical protein
MHDMSGSPWASWAKRAEDPAPPTEVPAGPTLCLVVLAQSHKALEQFSGSAGEVDELVKIVNPAARFGGLGAIANRVLDRTPCDVFGVVHADTTFASGALRAFAETAATGVVAGVLGRDLKGAYVTSKSVRIRARVSTLDCCSCFFPRSSGLRFDAETFDSFHCCVEDLCLTADSKRIAVCVPPIQALHKGSAREDWLRARQPYLAKLKAKWGHTRFMTT